MGACQRGTTQNKVQVREQGQATLEYILLLSVVLFGGFTLSKTLLSSLDAGILRLGGTLEKDLKTGRAKLGSWRN